MRFTLALPTDRADAPHEFTSGPAIREMAAHAEACGYDAVYVTDHPAPDTKWLETGGHHAIDALVALTWAAAATETLKVHTHVYIVAYRNPFISAKAIATLDALSDGRLILGVAAGYLRPEFESLGVDYDRRNELLDQGIDMMKAAWTGGTITVDTADIQSRGTVVLPLPTQKPHPPIWIGGNSKAAIRRVVARGNGWSPFANPSAATRTKTAVLDSIDELARRIGILRELAAEAERTDPIDICFAPFAQGFGGHATTTKAQLTEEIAALADLGVTWVPAQFSGDTRADWMRNVERYANDFIPPRRTDPASRGILGSLSRSDG